MLLGGGAGLVALNLGDDAYRDLEPFGEAGEAAPQAVQCQTVYAGGGTGSAVRDVWVG